MTTETQKPHTFTPIAPQAMEIYRANIRPQLTDSDKGKFITIDVETGEWLMDADEERLSVTTRQQMRSGGRRFTLRAGWPATHSFRPGLNRELAEW